ncbi:hypothetical protein EWE75_07175 [Sphingomonas populi]|uniref:Flagellar motor switch protein FliN-like C-terminal domain-containing protein n=1 Tax=Sphingomonas populi TaxID=2484750 RepID=A0A4Q6XY83_9SPHN|nr:FliM/FliN family flagellar motor switch protein [Sphingomonas populi]RZF65145.1 hypothetical protein EWE75_07175 [Sphingomonas populi]
MQDTDPAAAPVDAPRAPDITFNVPLTIEIEDSVVPLDRLQGLREGAVLPIGSDGGAIAVRILASGRPLARGTLVAIGEGYGVLIAGDA